VAHQVAGDGDAGLVEEGLDLAVHQVQLDQRGGAHAVDHHDHVAAGVVEVVQDRVHQLLGDLPGGADLLAVAARLAVDADADLHLVLGQVEGGLAGGGHGAAGQGHAHGAAALVDLVGDGDDSVQV